YNKEKNISKTIQFLLDSDYPYLKKIFVVDDCSTDNSWSIIKKFARENSRVIALQTPKNTGKASGAKNYGAKFANSDLIGFVDADSYPQKDAIRKMIGFFDDEKIVAVTPTILVEKKEKFIEKLQSIEYKIIAFTRKLLGCVDAIYVTPGPLAIYKKKIFDELGGFDETNLTEDIEITWHFISKGYKVGMSTLSRVYTIAPDNFKEWFNQRVRWNVGGIQTINKYKKTFFRKGMLGRFVLPFFVLSWFLGVFGLSVLFYRTFQKIIIRYLSTAYSIQAQTVILTLREINLTPNVLIFFGTALFILSLSFTMLALSYSRDGGSKKSGLFGILIYMFIYLLLYPVLLVTSMYKFLRGKRSW
ncbi:MAG TPA: glycosyltransferase, partial [Candidatus Paceibacterota bacterium]|nr:glycosyltransferase [Candidatus Paceibacterota bacterium]